MIDNDVLKDVNKKYARSGNVGRPPMDEASKDKQYRLRMSDDEIKRLEYCCSVLGLSKADVIRQGIRLMYEKVSKPHC